jgi:Na+-translocating ferredoxin:NAD+ oxidoreductase RnfG subunit
MTMPRYVVLPLAAVAVCQPAGATVFLSVEQAQQLMFPGATLTPLPLALSAEQVAAVEHESGTRYHAGAVKAWRAPDGVLYIDAVVGKHDLITYAVAVGNDGRVRQVEILEYREAYGGEVRNAGFRRQFTGKSHADPLLVGRDIQNISGATLSTQHVTDGVRRILAIHAIAKL